MKQPMKLNAAEFSTVVWYWTAPVGQSPEDLLAPEYWQHVARQLRPGHEIRVVAEDRTFWSHLFVREVGKMQAKVSVISSVQFDPVESEDDDADYTVKWRSPKSFYGVFRKSDGECLEDKFQTKEAAHVWAIQNAARMAA